MAESGGEERFKMVLPEGVAFNIHCSEGPIHCCYVKPPAGLKVRIGFCLKVKACIFTPLEYIRLRTTL